MSTDPKDFPRQDLTSGLASAQVQVVFAYRNTAKDWHLKLLPLHGELQETFRARAEAAAQRLSTAMTGRAYDPQWELAGGEFMYLANDPPVGGNLFPKLATFAQLPPFQERRRIRQPNAWIVIAQLPDNTVTYLGARITAKSILSRDNRILRIVYRDEAFDALDDTVVTLGSDFDWIAWRGTMIVLHAADFRMTFRDIPALIAQVDANVVALMQHVSIDNIDAFKSRIKAFPGMMVKLQGIIDRADMYTQPASVLRGYATKYSIAITWNGDSMVFDGSVETQWNILRLLDEARTLGPVTGKHWDTSSKVEV